MWQFTPGQRATALFLGLLSLFNVGLLVHLHVARTLPVVEAAVFQPSPVPRRGADEPCLRVHVTGHVKQPGVYAFSADDRVIDAIDRAGGATEDAVLNDLNLAAHLRDGLRLYLPGPDDGPSDEVIVVTEELTVAPTRPPREPDAGPSEPGPEVTDVGAVTSSSSSDRKPPPSGRVNLNTAGLEELATLPGIGPTYARRILAYRETMGPFRTIEDLKQVRGIGDKTLERLRAYVSVD